jgi:hypothetical protein
MKTAIWIITEEKAKELTRLLDAAVKGWGLENNVALNASILAKEIMTLEFKEEVEKPKK